MGYLTEGDVQILKQLREEGVLSEVSLDSMDLSNGVIMLTCADGDQFESYYSHLAELTKKQLARPRVHTLALNGGALLLSDLWPTKEEGVALERHISAAVDLKKIYTVVLFVHAPCGAAGLCHWTIEQVIDAGVQAKTRIKSLRSDVKVICLIHVDWGHDKKRTYFLSRDKWLARK